MDFETFQTAGPSSSAEVSGGVCTDSFVVSGTSGLSTPVICGSNAGQHSKLLYIVSWDTVTVQEQQKYVLSCI